MRIGPASGDISFPFMLAFAISARPRGSYPLLLVMPPFSGCSRLFRSRPLFPEGGGGTLPSVVVATRRRDEEVPFAGSS